MKAAKCNFEFILHLNFQSGHRTQSCVYDIPGINRLSLTITVQLHNGRN